MDFGFCLTDQTEQMVPYSSFVTLCTEWSN